MQASTTQACPSPSPRQVPALQLLLVSGLLSSNASQPTPRVHSPCLHQRQRLQCTILLLCPLSRGKGQASKGGFNALSRPHALASRVGPEFSLHTKCEDPQANWGSLMAPCARSLGKTAFRRCCATSVSPISALSHYAFVKLICHCKCSLFSSLVAPGVDPSLLE